MGDEAEARIEYLQSTPNLNDIARRHQSVRFEETVCKHDIIAEWCWECKHESTSTVKSLLLTENLKIVENLLSWETPKSRTS